jgi:CubicO group peptidase (beta-lactamase class C family)
MLDQGSPPQRDDRVSAADWLTAPANRWAVWHVRELMPTQAIPRGDGEVRAMPRPEDPVDVSAIEVIRVDGTSATVSEVLAHTFTDAFAVLHDGRLVAEAYAPGGGPDLAHATLSVTKSVVGCVAGVLVDTGALSTDREVAHYVPELAGTGYAAATVRDLLDMRSGVRFVEDYTSPRSDLRRMGRWVLGRGRLAGEGLYTYLATLRADRPHGGHFLYRSSETDVLGWVCERVAGTRMADLVSSLVWAPMGAERDAEISCDNHGTAVHDGGLGATARDLVRFGWLLLDGGRVDRSGEPVDVLPAHWLRHAWGVDSDIRRAFLDSPAEASFPGGWYRNQLWFRPGRFGDVLLCLGIHGQLVHVCRRTRTVCVKLSSWPTAQEPAFLQDTLRACDAIGGALSGRPERATAPGVVSGRDR